MADNVTITEGVGRTIRGDEVGTAILQVVKIGLGLDGVEDCLLDSGQQVSANSLPVVVASDNYVLTKDAGISQTTSYLNTNDADWSSASDITAAPTAGQKIVIVDLIISVATDCYVSLLEETSGTEIMRLYIAAYVPTPITTRGKIKLPTADRKLRMSSSVATAGSVFAIYYSEA